MGAGQDTDGRAGTRVTTSSDAERQVIAFDRVAERYDREFSETSIGRWYREAVWARAAVAFPAGSRVLDLGCGTGEDALWLAARGVRVVAVDLSAAMLGVTATKVARAGLGDRVLTHRMDVARLDAEILEEGGSFDGVLSNFGALNCVADLRPLADTLGRLVRPGGRAILVVMGRLCPWEIVWHLAHGRPGSAFRRFRRDGRADVAGEGVPIWHPTPRSLRRQFDSHFDSRECAGLGVVLPPPYLDHLVHLAPRVAAHLARLERRHGSKFPAGWLGDHFLLRLERRGLVHRS